MFACSIMHFKCHNKVTKYLHVCVCYIQNSDSRELKAQVSIHYIQHSERRELKMHACMCYIPHPESRELKAQVSVRYILHPECRELKMHVCIRIFESVSELAITFLQSKLSHLLILADESLDNSHVTWWHTSHYSEGSQFWCLLKFSLNLNKLKFITISSKQTCHPSRKKHLQLILLNSENEYLRSANILFE